MILNIVTLVSVVVLVVVSVVRFSITDVRSPFTELVFFYKNIDSCQSISL